MTRNWQPSRRPLPPPIIDDTPQRLAALRDELERLEEIHRDVPEYVPVRREQIERRIEALAAARGESR